MVRAVVRGRWFEGGGGLVGFRVSRGCGGGGYGLVDGAGVGADGASAAVEL